MKNYFSASMLHSEKKMMAMQEGKKQRTKKGCKEEDIADEGNYM